MSFEGAKNFTAALQSVVVSAGIIIGGGWTLYRFSTIEDVLSLDVSIQAQQSGRASAGDYAIVATVQIFNNGTQYVDVDLSQRPLLIQRIATVNERPFAVASWSPLAMRGYPSGPQHADGVVTYIQGVQPKSTKRVSFYQKVDAPGLYLLSFAAPVPPNASSKLDDLRVDDAAAAARVGSQIAPHAWLASCYVELQETAVQPPPDVR